MFAIVRATYSRLVRFGDQRQTPVRPPTLAEALTVLDALRHDDERLLWEVVEAWLPAEISLMLRRAPDAQRNTTLEALLTQGCDWEAVVRASAADEMAEATWRTAISVVATTYHTSPWRVMQWPFPFFLEMAIEARAERAREQLRQGEVASLPHLGKEAERLLQRWQEQAAGGSRTDDLTRPMTPDEVARNQHDLTAHYR